MNELPDFYNLDIDNIVSILLSKR